MATHGHQDVCTTALRRQNTQLRVDRKLTIAPKTPRRRPKERAPIVELLPFRRKVWKREKSFAYNAPVTTTSNDTPRITHEDDLKADTVQHVEPRIQTLTPRVSDHIVPSRQKGSSTKKVVPSSSIVHPGSPRIPKSSTDIKFPTFPDGFVTIGSRQRSTLEEIHERNKKLSNASKEKDTESYTHIKDTADETNNKASDNASYEDNDDNNKMHNEKARDLSPPQTTGGADRTPITFDRAKIQEWRTAPHTQFPQYHNNISRPYMNEDNLTNESIRKVRTSTETRHVTTPYEDFTFQRAVTLPSINIRNAPLKTRQKLHDTPRSEIVSKSDNTWWYSVRHDVPNTLQYMESKGRPMGLEKQLSMDLNITLENIRRNKSYHGTTQMPSVFRSPHRGYLKSRGPPTRGEKRIQEARKPNHPQETRIIRIPITNPHQPPPTIVHHRENQNSFKIPKSESKDSGIDSIEHYNNIRQHNIKTNDHFRSDVSIKTDNILSEHELSQNDHETSFDMENESDALKNELRKLFTDLKDKVNDIRNENSNNIPQTQ